VDERDSILWPTCVLAFRLNSHTDNIFLNSPGRLAGKWIMLMIMLMIAAVLVTVLAVALVMRNRKLARKRRSRCKFTYTLLLQCMNITNP